MVMLVLVMVAVVELEVECSGVLVVKNVSIPHTSPLHCSSHPPSPTPPPFHSTTYTHHSPAMHLLSACSLHPNTANPTSLHVNYRRKKWDPWTIVGLRGRVLCEWSCCLYRVFMREGVWRRWGRGEVRVLGASVGAIIMGFENTRC